MLWIGLPIEEAIQRRAGDRSERSGRRGWARVGSGRRSSSAMPSGRRLDRPSGLSSRYLGRPMSCALLANFSFGRAFVGKPVHEGPWVYEPYTFSLLSLSPFNHLLVMYL